MSSTTPTEPARTAGPTATTERITALDLIRGVAILGILPMNALAFGLDNAGYLNVSADGISQPLDWVIGIATMLFVDQKMMALFSLLFGVGVVIFADRAAAKQRRVVWLSLWRFALLAVVGLLHTLAWEGDVLLVYAVCAPLVLAMRRLPVRLLLVAGTLLALVGTLTAAMFQSAISDDTSQLGDLWFAGAEAMSATVETWYVLDAVGRALGLMLIGVALHRLGIVQGHRSEAFYRRMTQWGLGVGLAITAVGLVIRIVGDWAPEQAISGHIPTGLGTIPIALGYLALLARWNHSRSRWLEPLRNTGRMALTNYLTQTALGVVMLGGLFSGVDLTRTMIAVWIVAVWALQLWWSTWWLTRHRYGPFEWAWRCATYRTWQPLRRSPARR